MKPRHPRKAMRWEFRTGVLCGWSGCEDAAAMSEAGKLSWALNARCRGNFSAKCRKAGALWPRYDKAGCFRSAVFPERIRSRWAGQFCVCRAHQLLQDI